MNRLIARVLSVALWSVVVGSGLSVPLPAQAPAPRASAGTLTAVTPRAAQALVDDALVTAKAQHKTVLVYFGASWCGWCRRFEAFLAAPVVGTIMSDSYVLVDLTVLETTPDKQKLENPGGADLMKAMKGGGELPFFFFLDTSGKKLADSNVEPDGTDIGHPNTKVEIEAFDKLLALTAPHMTADQRAQIKAYLTKTALPE